MPIVVLTPFAARDRSAKKSLQCVRIVKYVSTQIFAVSMLFLHECRITMASSSAKINFNYFNVCHTHVIKYYVFNVLFNICKSSSGISKYIFFICPLVDLHQNWRIFE